MYRNYISSGRYYPKGSATGIHTHALLPCMEANRSKSMAGNQIAPKQTGGWETYSPRDQQNPRIQSGLKQTPTNHIPFRYGRFCPKSFVLTIRSCCTKLCANIDLAQGALRWDFLLILKVIRLRFHALKEELPEASQLSNTYSLGRTFGGEKEIVIEVH